MKNFKKHFKLKKLQSGISWEYLPNLCKILIKALMRYITLKGRFKVIYTYYFNLLNCFKFLVSNKLNFSFFICNSIRYSIERLRIDIVAFPLHESIIFLLYLKALDKQIPKFRIWARGQVFEKKINKDGGKNLISSNVNFSCRGLELIL